MANLLNQNPIIITGTQTSYKAAVAATLGSLFTLRVEKWYWRTPANVGDICLVIDPANGVERLRLRCEVAGQSILVDWTANPKIMSDFAIVQFDSGELEIHTR